MPPLSIRALTPATSADYFAFFDGDAFADNPRWGSCYCHFLWAPAEIKPWNRWTGVENRAAVATLIAARELQGQAVPPPGRRAAAARRGVRGLRARRPPDGRSLRAAR